MALESTSFVAEEDRDIQTSKDWMDLTGVGLESPYYATRTALIKSMTAHVGSVIHTGGDTMMDRFTALSGYDGAEVLPQNTNDPFPPQFDSNNPDAVEQWWGRREAENTAIFDKDKVAKVVGSLFGPYGGRQRLDIENGSPDDIHTLAEEVKVAIFHMQLEADTPFNHKVVTIGPDSLTPDRVQEITDFLGKREYAEGGAITLDEILIYNTLLEGMNDHVINRDEYREQMLGAIREDHNSLRAVNPSRIVHGSFEVSHNQRFVLVFEDMGDILLKAQKLKIPFGGVLRDIFPNSNHKYVRTIRVNRRTEREMQKLVVKLEKEGALDNTDGKFVGEYFTRGLTPNYIDRVDTPVDTVVEIATPEAQFDERSIDEIATTAMGKYQYRQLLEIEGGGSADINALAEAIRKELITETAKDTDHEYTTAHLGTELLTTENIENIRALIKEGSGPPTETQLGHVLLFSAMLAAYPDQRLGMEQAIKDSYSGDFDQVLFDVFGRGHNQRIIFTIGDVGDLLEKSDELELNQGIFLELLARSYPKEEVRFIEMNYRGEKAMIALAEEMIEKGRMRDSHRGFINGYFSARGIAKKMPKVPNIPELQKLIH